MIIYYTNTILHFDFFYGIFKTSAEVQTLLQRHHEQMKTRVAFSVHSDAVTEGYGAHHVVRFPNIFTNIGKKTLVLTNCPKKINL